MARTSKLKSFLLAAGAALAASAADAQTFMPGVSTDAKIPTVAEVLGAAPGTRITAPEEVIRYFRALEAAAPDRVKVVPYARSWQGRELVYAVIASPENLAKLGAFEDAMARLGDPRETDAATAADLIAETPSSAWLAYSVHGNEISSSDAAMMTAYHLLAAEDDETVEKILQNTVVFIDPVQNPDGRARFVTRFYDTLGMEPSGSPIAAERNEPWPSGRTNHYLFDMNRDWFALSQPETRGRVAAYLKYAPLIFVDLHEMGSDSTYYFSPEAEPFNPLITEAQKGVLEAIGANNAKYFDRFGFPYYTREVFDAFYPGYGAGWPNFLGSVGTTYEQASSRGLTAERADGTDLPYAETVRHHFVTSIATLETAAVNRESLLQGYYDYRKDAVEDGRGGPVKAYIIPTQTNQAGADKLAAVLAEQGVEVARTNEDFRACRTSYAAGSYIVPLDQPANRLVRTLMDPDTGFPEDFAKEQERRRAKGLSVEVYDVTAWSLPLMWNVRSDTCNAKPTVDAAPATATRIPPGTLTNADAAFGFAVPAGDVSASRLLAAALRAELPVLSSDLPFTVGERTFPRGSLILPKAGAPDDLAKRLAALAETTGADVFGLDTSYTVSGPNWGSENVYRHHAPKVAIAWDEPTSQYSAGNTRFVIERQIGWPVTPVRTEDIASDHLASFDVLILPDGYGYGGVLGGRGADALKEWTREGGVLIAFDGALSWLGDPKTEFSALRRENAYQETEAKKAEDAAAVPGVLLETRDDLAAATTPAAARPDRALGVLVKAETDPDHWLTAGVGSSVNVLFSGSEIFAPLARDSGTTAVSYASKYELLLSGYLWDDVRAQMAYKPFVTVEPMGRGYVISFTEDPTTRAYLDGLQTLLANAVFRGAAHARPVR